MLIYTFSGFVLQKMAKTRKNFTFFQKRLVITKKAKNDLYFLVFAIF